MKTTRNWTDAVLLEKLQNPRTLNQALDEIYGKCYDALEYYILQNSGSKQDAEDSIQEAILVFINMVQNGRFREEASIKSVLYSINKNVWLTELRKRKSRAVRDTAYEVEKGKDMPDYSSELVKMEGYKQVMDLFETLGKGCRKILTLFYFDQYSMEEITLMEGFSNEQVLRNKKYKCMKTLMSLIEHDDSLYKKLQTILKDGIQ